MAQRGPRSLGVATALLASVLSWPAGAAALPGAEPHGAELQAQLARALKAEGASYVPRTRHRLPDGSPKYTNRLMLESSPYLRQHSHNPVDWYPWGDEAFDVARRLGRPVLLSIGYSTCHWCHVMEEESFEDEEIAAFLNANYVPIKVDREERPDVDAIYMAAVQAMVGRGGWPMTTWLNPDRQPFYGGTYFPARDGDRGSRKGFLTLLRELKQLYDAQPDTVALRAEQITAGIRTSMVPAAGKELPGSESVARAARQYQSMFDPTHGGLRRAPKFPSSFPVRLLLRHHARSGDAAFLDMVSLTLTRMAHGGMYDQIGGGFHRYSVTGDWLVPHFEKMLYDNALLTVAYLEGFQSTGNDEFARVAREILDYVSREMTAPGGAFYSATDADSLNPEGEREEGWFFTWTPAELRAVLTPDEARAVEAYYGVTAKGNFEGRTILNVRGTPEQAAARLGIDVATLHVRLAGAGRKLYDARAKRPQPLRDDKILTSWNGLMISAFATGGFVLDDPALTSAAERAADFVLEQLRVDGRLRRSYKSGRARFAAYLDDYAFLIGGLLDLFETTGAPRWIEEAIALQRVLDKHYADADNGGYFMTGDDHETLLAREKPAYDGAEPSGNSVALFNLLRLYELTTDESYRRSAESLLRSFGSVIQRSPRALSEMLMGLDFYSASAKEVVIVTPQGGNADAFLRVLRESFLPYKVVARVEEGAQAQRQARSMSLVRGKVAREGKTTAYVCESGVCQLPTTDVDVFAEQLRKPAPSAPEPVD